VSYDHTDKSESGERKMAEPWYEAYTARFADSSFGSDAIGLFALGLVYGIEDLDSLGAEIITGGGNDKKCDLVYLDVEESRAVIAQCYLALNDNKPAAPANKAADLMIAVGWLLNRQIEQVPDPIRGSAAELRDAIKTGKVHEIGIWYVHNLPESQNVKDELKTVEESALERSVLPQRSEYRYVRLEEKLLKNYLRIVVHLYWFPISSVSARTARSKFIPKVGLSNDDTWYSVAQAIQHIQREIVFSERERLLRFSSIRFKYK
jgi:hypothetical protein